jgi:hypothetical protein
MNRQAMKTAFKAFFDDAFDEGRANVDWTGWQSERGGDRVLVDAVFDLDTLIDRIVEAADAPTESS